MNSEKEELIEISIGSSKEFQSPSSEEYDNESSKSRFTRNIDITSQSDNLEESKESEKDSSNLSKLFYAKVSDKSLSKASNKNSNRFSNNSSEKESFKVPLSNSKDRLSSKDSNKEERLSNESNLSRKDFPTENSIGSSKEIEQEGTDGSSKEVCAEKSSEGSIKEVARSSNNENEEDHINSEAGSSKERFRDSDISSVKVRLIHSSKDNFEGSSLGSERERWDLDFTENEMDKSINSKDSVKEFEDNETVEISDGSLKEEEMEESTGSLKEEYFEKSDQSSKEILNTKKDSSIQDGDIEEKESSKELFRSIEEFKNSDDYTPSAEESEENEAEIMSRRPEKLSSQQEQSSESECESTPKNIQPYFDPKIRENVLKINTILKRAPASISIRAKNFIHMRRTSEVNQSQKDPFKNKQLLGDYRDQTAPMIPIDSRANSKQPNSLERKPRPANYRSMETLPSGPKDKENTYDYNQPSDRYKKPFSYQPRASNNGNKYYRCNCKIYL